MREHLQIYSRQLEAYDDGFFPHTFKSGRGTTIIAGVEVDRSLRPVKITIMSVRVDLNTSTRAIINMSRLLNGEVILLDGVTYAGFDVIDPVEVNRELGKGVIVIFLHPLNLPRIKTALQKHFNDWNERYRVIEQVYSNSIFYYTPWRPVRVYIEGITRDVAMSILKETCIYSPIPEPLRIADKIASNLSRIYIHNKYA